MMKFAHLRKLLQSVQNSAKSQKRNRKLLRQLLIEQMEDRRVFATIDLATLTAEQGYTIFGAEAVDISGSSVGNAGDVNGDGFDDLIISAPRADGIGNARYNSGECYVIFGNAVTTANIDLALSGAAGITIYGIEANDGNRAVSGAGDVNGDGFDDIIIGSARHGRNPNNFRSYAGESYVIFGGAMLPSAIDLANMGSLGLTISGGEPYDGCGATVSGAGDVNSDGFDDVLIGCTGGDAMGNSRTDAGESFLIFGNASLPSRIDQPNLGNLGIAIYGAFAQNSSGNAISSAGDVNGDGFDDVIIGARNAFNAGVSYVIFGGPTLPAQIDLANLGAAGFAIYGADSGDLSGYSLSDAGDVNGDGLDDLLVSAISADGPGNSRESTGDCYLIFGRTSFGGNINLANLGSAGITFFGARSLDRTGSSVSKAGDINGDGFDDIIIGARYVNNRGASYVVFGSSSLPSSIDFLSPDFGGIKILGIDVRDNCGSSVSSAGDVNGDGFDDLVIGSNTADSILNSRQDAGESYLVYGGNFTNAVTQQGTATGETITGTANANVINGAGGDDILVGAGGADVLIGGQGSDIIAISGLPFNRIVGGTGADTLRLEGAAVSLDLTALPDNRLLGIERINITGSGDNTLTVNVREVLNISDESNTLIVYRNQGDIVNKGTGWTQRANETIGTDTFLVYTQGAACLKILSTNREPTDILLSKDLTEENAPISTLIGNFRTTDPDSDETFIYSLVSGSGASDNAAFTIDGNQLKTNSVFNFEAKNTYSIRVRTTDAGGLTFEKTFAISVTDVNEAPGMSLTNRVSLVAESNAAGLDIADVVINDDALGTNAIILTGPDASMFEVAGGKLKLKPSSLDFETKPTLRVTVSVDDPTVGSTPDQSIDVVLNVTDVNEAPGLSLTNRVSLVAESNAAGLDIADVVINDDALGTNAIILTGPDASMFEVAGGKLKLKPSSLDFETKPTLRVTVSVDDQTVGSTPDQSIDVVLNVTDVNEAPGLSLTNRVSLVAESNAAGLDIADVVINDDALGTNTIILTGPDASMFEVSGGKLKLKPSSLDFETKPTLRVTVSVDDPTVGSSPDQSIDVVLNLTDVNEAPALVVANTVSSVLESNTAGLNVADVAIIDDALGTYSISLSGPDAALFEVSSGKLKLKPSALDFETKPTLRVSVSVDDPTVGSTPDQVVNFVLNVTDVNEVPSFTLTTLASSVPESNTIGLNVADIAIQDDALGVNTISLSGPDAAMFQVTGDKLKLRPGSLDFETKPTLRVTVSLDDPTVGRSPDQSIEVVLSVTDVNEAPTEVVFTNILLRAAEEITLTQAGVVADISVTDDALGTNELSLQGPDVQYFEIVNNKLRLKAGTRFDFETQSVYRVQVVAKDLSLTSSTSVSRDYVLNIDNVPEVAGVTIVDGQGWNDSVRQVRIPFDTIVNLTNSAIEWSKKDVGGALVPFVMQTSVVNNRTVADIRFQGKYVDAVGLFDGSYDLTVRGDQVSGAATGFLGLSYTESFLAVRPKPAFAMNISLAPTIAIGAVASLGVQLVGASGTGIRYDIDLDGDGVIDRNVLGGTAIVLNDAVFTQGGSRTVQVTATRSGVTLSQGSAVIDVVPYIVRGSRWISTLDVDADETVSPLDVLGVINWLNDSSSDRRYSLNLDVDRDASISPLDVLAIINHINSEGSGASPSPFVSLVMNDSGASDGLTSNVGIQGRAKETNAKLFLALDGAPRREVIGAIGANGSFDLTDAAIAQLFGSSLEGDHLLTIGTVGSNGAWRGMDRRFTRTSRSLNAFELTTALQNGGLSLAWGSAGSGSRYRVMQSVEGQSSVLLADGLSAPSTRIDLPIGFYDLFVEAYDALGNKQRSQTVRVRIV